MSENPLPLGAVLAEGTARLRQAGITAPEREARLLLAQASGLGPHIIMAWPERMIAADQAALFHQLIAARAAHRPLSRIIGVREFWSLPFSLSPDTLDPRADTETLIEAVLARIGDKAAPLRIIDFGTGSGCILLSLLSELKHASGLGIDLSPGAVVTATANARTLGVDDRALFRCDDWDAGLDTTHTGCYDLVISNPPYIETAIIATLDPGVRDHDPHLALDGGVDGLTPYRHLVPTAARLLKPGGLVAFEVGSGQAPTVGALLAHHGFGGIACCPDLAGIDRVVLGHSANRSSCGDCPPETNQQTPTIQK